MASWRQTWQRHQRVRTRQLSVVEILESRVLYSADSVASLLPLLMPDELDVTPSVDSSVLSDPEAVLTESDLRSPIVEPLSPIKHVVFVDSAVPEIDSLVDSVNKEHTEIVVIDAQTDAIAEITQTLASYGDLSSVQIISHGSSGQLSLGGASITEQSLLDKKHAIASWSDALTIDGDILLLGCDVASGEAGIRFVEQLASLVGSDVAASTDKTGHSQEGGDWDLEYVVGDINVDWKPIGEFQDHWTYTLGTITIDTMTDKFSNVIQDTWNIGSLASYQTANNFEVSLREAVYVAQNFDDIDTIRLPGGNYTLTIAPTGADDGKSGDLNVSEDTILLGLGNDATPSVLTQGVAGNRIITGDAGTLTLNNVTLDGASYTAGRGGAVYSDANVELIDAKLENNSSDFDGGAVATLGDLTVQGSEFRNNSSDVFGGALYSEGEITITDSLFVANHSVDDGGAVYAFGQRLTIEGSAFTGNYTDSPDAGGVIGNGGAVAGTSDIVVNRSSFDNNETRNVNLMSLGGAIHHSASGSLAISDVTFSANQAVSGGAIYTNQTATVSSSTFVDNQAILNGASIWVDGASLQLDSSFYSGNEFISPAAAGSSLVVVSPQHIVFGSVSSAGFNLFDFDPSAQVTVANSDIVNTIAVSVSSQIDPLSTRADSYVKVHALKEGSQAINAGKVNLANAEDAQGLARDQLSDIGSSEHNGQDSVVVWADINGDIFRSDLEFTNVQQIVDAAVTPESINVSESTASVYWLADGNTEVASSPLDGVGGQSTVLTNLVAATGMALDSAAAHLYVSFAGALPRIDRYDLNNLAASPTTVVDNSTSYTTSLSPAEIIANPGNIAFNTNSGKLVWVEEGDGTIPASIRVFTASDNTIDLVSASVVADSVALNPEGTEVYWTETASDLVSYYDFDTQNQAQVDTQSSDTSPTGIAYAKSEDQILWISEAANNIDTTDAINASSVARYIHSSATQDITTMRTSSVTDTPTIQTNNPLNLNEGSEKLIEELQLSAFDSDSGLGDLVYTVTDAPANGELLLNGLPTVQFTQENVNDDVVVYRHDGTETVVDQIEFQVSDGLNSSDRFKYDISINRVNDAPTLTVATDINDISLSMYLEEDNVHVLSSSLLIGSDPETPADSLVYTLNSVTTAGRFMVAGVESTTFTGAQLASGEALFEHDGSELAPDSLVFQVFDDAAENSESGGVTIDFDFHLVNDAPVLTTIPISVFENGTVLISNQNLVISDPDLGTDLVTYSLVEIPSHGTVSVGNVPLTSTSDTFSQIDINNGFLSYSPSVNISESQNSNFSILFVATDPQGDSSGPVALDVQLTGINNAPELTTAPLEIEEGEEVMLTTANLVVSDSDTSSDDWVIGFRPTDNSNGSLSVLFAPQEIDDDGYHIFAYRDLLQGNVFYRHDGGESDSAQLAFRVSDGITTTDERLLNISVNPVDDIPQLMLSSNRMTVDEGGSYVFQPADFNVIDADAIDIDHIVSASLPVEAKGQILLEGVVSNSFRLSDLAEGRVSYQHAGEEPDVVGSTEEIVFTVSDGVAVSSAVTLVFDVQSTNDLPVFTFTPADEPIIENVEGGVVGRLSVSDADTGDVIEVTLNDNRFELIPEVDVDNSYTVILASGQAIDYEVDATSNGLFNLEVSAFDTNPNVERNPTYQGVQHEELIQVENVNDAPVINLASVANEVVGTGYTFDSSWVEDQDNNAEELLFSATLIDGAPLPDWLSFNSESRRFEVIDPESPDIRNLDLMIRIDDGFGGTDSVPLRLYFASQTDFEPTDPVQEPEVEPEIEPESEPSLEAAAPTPVSSELGELVLSSSESEKPGTSSASVTGTGGGGAASASAASGTGGGLSTSQSGIDARDDDLEMTMRAQKEAEEHEARLYEKVDIHDLVKPLDSFGTLVLAELGDDDRLKGSSSVASQVGADLDTRDLAQIFADSKAAFDAQSSVLVVGMDNKVYPDEERSAAMKALFGTSTGISTGLSVGYLIWLIRGGTLMGGVLSSLPAWRFVDPLPVLASITEASDDDEESLETIVDSSGQAVESTQRGRFSSASGFLSKVMGLKR